MVVTKAIRDDRRDGPSGEEVPSQCRATFLALSIGLPLLLSVLGATVPPQRSLSHAPILWSCVSRRVFLGCGCAGVLEVSAERGVWSDARNTEAREHGGADTLRMLHFERLPAAAAAAAAAANA
eukprot:632535-Rhodomonas_salina.1